MATTFTLKIADGSLDDISLANTSTTGIIGAQGGFGPTRIPNKLLMGGRIAETYVLDLKGSSHDNAATQIQALVMMLKKARDYHAATWQSAPVYLEAQTSGETNARRAIVYTAVEMEVPDLFDVMFQTNNLLEEFKVTLIREHPWRSGVPHTEGSAIYLRPQWDSSALDVADFAVGTTGSSTFTDEPNGWIKVFVDSTPNTAYGGYHAPTDEAVITARFEVDPDTITIATATEFHLFRYQMDVAVSGNVLVVMLGLGYTAGSGYYISSYTYDDTGALVATGTAQYIDGPSEVVVEHYAEQNAGSDGGWCKVWVNGVLALNASGLNNDQMLTDSVYIGAIGGLDAGTTGTFYIRNLTVSTTQFGSPVEMPVANFRDDVALTHVFVDDGGVFGSNIIKAAGGTKLFPAVPATGDKLYFGSTDDAFKSVAVDVETGGVWNWAYGLEYYNGSTWATLPTWTMYPHHSSDRGYFLGGGTTGLQVMWLLPPSDWTKTTINSVNAFWVRVNLTVTATTTVPTKGDVPIRAINDHYIEIPGSSIKGDAPPLSITRIRTGDNGSSAVSPMNTSRILIGAKSEHGDVSLDRFEPWINLGNVDNPSGWAITNGTDATSVVDVQDPGGKHCAVSFSTDATMVARVTATATDLLAHYEGEYRLLVGVKQVGSSAGEILVKGRIFVGGSADTDPHTDTRERKTRGADDGTEVLDLGLIALPMTRRHHGDQLYDKSFSIQLHAKRETGTGTLEIGWIYLFPVAEGSVGVDDPVTDLATGSSALRGDHVLDIDNGVIADRTVKYVEDGTYMVPVEEWARFNRPIEFFDLGKRTRLYFLMEHYSDNGWNREPLIAGIGMGVVVEMFMHYSYNVLRGSD